MERDVWDLPEMQKVVDAHLAYMRWLCMRGGRLAMEAGIDRVSGFEACLAQDIYMTVRAARQGPRQRDLGHAYYLYSRSTMRDSANHLVDAEMLNRMGDRYYPANFLISFFEHEERDEMQYIARLQIARDALKRAETAQKT